MSAWIATVIAVAALGFSVWQWVQRKQEAKRHDSEARVARVSDKLVELSKTAPSPEAASLRLRPLEEALPVSEQT